MFFLGRSPSFHGNILLPWQHQRVHKQKVLIYQLLWLRRPFSFYISRKSSKRNITTTSQILWNQTHDDATGGPKSLEDNGLSSPSSQVLVVIKCFNSWRFNRYSLTSPLANAEVKTCDCCQVIAVEDIPCELPAILKFFQLESTRIDGDGTLDVENWLSTFSTL